MIRKFLVEIVVAFFPKKDRAELRHRLRHLHNILYVKRTAKSVGKNFRCGEKILISKKTSIGDNVSINGIFVQGSGNLIIEDYCRIGIELLALTSSHNYEGNKIPYGDEEIQKDIKIGKGCWIGSRVTLLPGTELEEGVIVQAGAVVHGKIPAGSIVGGNPAKVFKQRDMDNYNKNKNNNSYYISPFFNNAGEN